MADENQQLPQWPQSPPSTASWGGGPPSGQGTSPLAPGYGGPQGSWPTSPSSQALRNPQPGPYAGGYANLPLRTESKTFSIIAIILGGISFLFLPIVLGPAAIILGAIAVSKKEKWGVVGLVVGIVGMITGMIFGFIVGSGAL
jgi:hypothetical protein